MLVTVIGAGDSRDAAPAIARYFLRKVIPEKAKAEDYLKTSGLDYTIIRPGGLLDKEPQGRAYLTEDTRAMSWIRRSDLAALMVQALDDPRAIGKVYHAFDPEPHPVLVDTRKLSAGPGRRATRSASAGVGP